MGADPDNGDCPGPAGDIRETGCLGADARRAEAPAGSAETPLHALLLLGGTVIVVQGFETTRYLGEHYCPETRIRASRLSQIISTVVYVAFTEKGGGGFTNSSRMNPTTSRIAIEPKPTRWL